MNHAEAQAIVSAALAGNHVIRALYEQIDAQSSITIDPSDDARWGSKTLAAGTSISVTHSKHPLECLAHELLHAELKLAGFRQHCTFVQTNAEAIVMDVAMALDNELQHHRMFARYLGLGLDPACFYSDSDATTYDDIRARLKRAKPGRTTSARYFLMYLSVIAPGGAGGENKREQLQRFFAMTVPKEQWACIEEAADKLIQWGADTGLDPGPTICEIIRALGAYDGWWIGASQTFPDDGQFIRTPFTLADAERYDQLAKRLS